MKSPRWMQRPPRYWGIPPFIEQRRIVSVLNEAFEGIAAVKGNAERNLQNARALFESHLQAVFADAWRTCEVVRLPDLAANITDGDHLPPPKSTIGVPFITIGNILKETRTIDFADTFTLKAAGWGLVEGSRIRREYPITPGRIEGQGRRGKPLTADFGHEQLIEMQKIIHAEKSDLFDVLAYVAYALPPLTRQERASRARLAIDGRFNSKQQAFLDFVLAHYVGEGVEELDQEKLTPLLRLKYHSITDALMDLGQPEEIGQVFAGFQKYLYQSQPDA
jgi:hypothetical protein